VRRGLALEPEDRYASMSELLDALRRTASRRSARRVAEAALVAAVVLAAVAALTVELGREHSPAVDSSVCERSPEAEIPSAWSPAQRASLMQRPAESPDLDRWLDELDGFAARSARGHGWGDATPEQAATAVVASVPDAVLHDTTRSSGRTHEPPARVPPPRAVSATAKCSKANFAAVCEAASPRRHDVQAALRNLKACRDAGAITEADFERYQTALVAKL
jgi:hypothetical protein